MKFVKLFVLIALVALAGVFVVATASAADKWSSDPSNVAPGAFCDDGVPDSGDSGNAWYQVQHVNSEGQTDFIGSVVACSGWDAIWRFALVHNYDSTDAAGLETFVGNRGHLHVADLPDIGAYSP